MPHNQPTNAATSLNVNDDLASCASMLGVCLLYDPTSAEAQPVVAGLAESDLAQEWPFGSDDAVDRAQQLIGQGFAASERDLRLGYTALFIGLGHNPAPCWGSVYLDHDHIVFGNSTVELRRWMRYNGISLQQEESREPEDQAGRMFLLLGWLAKNKPELVDEFTALHMMPWMPRYLDRLEAQAESPLYQGLAALAKTVLGLA